MAALASDWLRHFQLLLWNRYTEFKETWQDARFQRPLPSFSGQSEKQDGRPGLWFGETFSTSILKPLNGFQRNLTGSNISTSSTKFVFLWPISKQKGPPWSIPLRGGTLCSGVRYVALWPLVSAPEPEDQVQYCDHACPSSLCLLTFHIFDFSSETRNGTYKVCISGPIRKTRWPPRPLIGWDILDFPSETNERNSKKLDSKQDLNIFYQVCVFRAYRKNRIVALGSDLLTHIRLLLLNR